MKLIAMAMLILAVAGLSGCAGLARLPQCKGPWTPINAPAEAANET